MRGGGAAIVRVAAGFGLAMVLAAPLAAPATPADAAAPSRAAVDDSVAITLTAAAGVVVDSRQPDVATLDATRLAVGRASIQSWHSLVRFDLSPVPANASIIDARLELHQFAGGSVDPVRVSAALVVEDWRVGHVTWNDQPRLGDSIAAQSLDTTPGWEEFRVVRLVTGWFRGRAPNFGLAVRTVSDSTFPEREQERTFANRGANRPRLVIVYALPPPTRTPAPTGTATPTATARPTQTRVPVPPTPTRTATAVRTTVPAPPPRTRLWLPIALRSGGP